MTQFIEHINLIMNSVSIKYTPEETTYYCQVKRFADFKYANNVIGTICFECIMPSGERVLNIVGLLYRRGPGSLEDQVIFDSMTKSGEFNYEDIVVEIWIVTDIKEKVEVQIPTLVLRLVEEKPSALSSFYSQPQSGVIDVKDRRHYD